MLIHRSALAGALLLYPALATADEPPPIPYAARLAPVPLGPVPDGSGVPRLRYKRHSTALMTGGIVLTAIGALSIIGGVTAIVASPRNSNDSQGPFPGILGAALFIHAAGCIAGGIPMWRIGAKDVPAGWAAATPSISLGKTSTLRWTF
jgi:hypothetical protein